MKAQVEKTTHCCFRVFRLRPTRSSIHRCFACGAHSTLVDGTGNQALLPKLGDFCSIPPAVSVDLRVVQSAADQSRSVRLRILVRREHDSKELKGIHIPLNLVCLRASVMVNPSAT